MKPLTLFTVFVLFFTFFPAQSFAEPFPKEADVCVYGGTPSGLVAAVAAKQEGMNVVVVEPSRWLGGILGAGIKPLQDCPEPRSVGGLTKKHIFKMGNLPPVFRKSSVDWMRENEIPVLYEYRFAAAEKDGTRIKSIRLEHAPPDRYGVPAPKADPSKFRIITAKMFIDASYDGDLMAGAGVSYAVGREAKSDFDEAAAGVGPPTNWTPIDPYVEPGKPESGLLKLVDADHGKPLGAGDDYTQAYNYRFYIMKDEDKKAPFGVPDDYAPEDYELLGRYVEYLVKTLADNEKQLMFKLSEIFPGWPNSGDHNYKRESLFTIAPLGVSRFYQDGDWKTKHDAWQWHRDYLRGIHRFLSTDPRVPESFRKQTAEYGLDRTMHEDTDGWPNQLYVRISRRMRGEAILDLHDVWNERAHEDGVGLALYGVDTYPVRRYAVADPETGKLGVATEGNMFIGGSRGTKIPYQIPFGAILPKREQCTNLVVPVCFSATYIAYASARMEPVFCILGESAAVAAAQAVRNRCDVQAIDKNAFKSKLLERGQILRWEPPEVKYPDWRNQAAKNLAPSAKASASSLFEHPDRYDAAYVNDGIIDTTTDKKRWVSARGDTTPYVELRFEKPVAVNAFCIVTGKHEGDEVVHPITGFRLQYEDADGRWLEVEGTAVSDNLDSIVARRFKRMVASAFRLVVTESPGGIARLWEWELYDLDDERK